MKDILCIDLSYDDKLLESFSSEFFLNIDDILNAKESGFAKLWIGIPSKMIIAFSLKSNRNRAVASDHLINYLSDMTSYQQPKVFDLNINEILEKISKHGIDSLSDDELDFLKK